MTPTDELTLLHAVASKPEGAWLCDVRRQIPNASAVRVLAGLSQLVRRGLVTETTGAMGMAEYRLTLEGQYRMRRPPPMRRAA